MIRKFISRVLLFIAPVILLGLAAEYLLRKIPNDYSKKGQYIEKEGSEIETLILGSSHAFRGLNPTHFEDNTYNLAYVSQTLDIDSKLMLNNIDSFKSLKSVVFVISYFSFFKTLKSGAEAWRVKNYNLYLNLNNNLGKYKSSELLDTEGLISVKRLVGHYVVTKKYVTIDSLGFAAREGKDDINFEAHGKSTAKRHTVELPGEYSEISKQFFKTLNVLCTQGIKCYLINPPMTKEYRRYSSKNQFNKMNFICDSLASSNNLIYHYNLTEDSTFKLKHFTNSDHLNQKGAEKLSKMVNAFIKSGN